MRTAKRTINKVPQIGVCVVCNRDANWMLECTPIEVLPGVEPILEEDAPTIYILLCTKHCLSLTNNNPYIDASGSTGDW